MKAIYNKTLKHYNDPGHYHELTFSCFQQLPLLAKDRPRLWFMESLEKSCTIHSFQLHAFVIMPDHVHLIISPNSSEYDVALFLQSLKQSVSRKAKAWLKKNDPKWLQQLTNISPDGRAHFHFWRHSGGYDRNVISDKILQSMIDYIHMNPVTRGLVDSELDWKWSSARWYWNDCQSSIFTIINDFSE